MILPTPPPRESIELQLGRILASGGFVNSMRMGRFLRFTVERVLNGDTDRIKEYVLGVEVFDRRPSFDPRSDAVVRVEARRLRAKLQEYYETDGQSDPIRIELPKGSYVPTFQENRPAASDAPAPLARAAVWRSSFAAFAGASVIVAVLLGVAYETGRRSVLHLSLGGEAPLSSIAVFPFVDMSEQHDQEYLCEGITEELVHTLAQIPGLRVPGRSSLSRLRNSSIEDAGRQLHIDHVLEGSVRRDGGRLRVTVELTRVSDSSQIWSRSFDEKASDTLTSEQEIARAISSRLRLQLAASHVRHAPAASTNDPEARNLYLLGRFYSNKMTSASTRQAVNYFERAVRKDPKYSRAYAGLADAYDLAYLFAALPSAQASAGAKLAATRALHIDDSVAEAHASQARALMWVDGDWSSAERELQRAIDLDPLYAEAYQLYSWNLAFRGRNAEALDTIQKAIDLDPLSPRIRTVEAMLFVVSRQYEKAIDAARQAIEIDPSYGRAYQTLGRALVLQGGHEEAVHAIEKSIELGAGDGGKGLLGWAYASIGRRKEALSILKQLSGADPQPVFGMAGIYAALGDRDAAFQCLEKAFLDHAYIAEVVYPDWDKLHADPRYPALLRRIGLGSAIQTGKL